MSLVLKQIFRPQNFYGRFTAHTPSTETLYCSFISMTWLEVNLLLRFTFMLSTFPPPPSHHPYLRQGHQTKSCSFTGNPYTVRRHMRQALITQNKFQTFPETIRGLLRDKHSRSAKIHNKVTLWP